MRLKGKTNVSSRQQARIKGQGGSVNGALLVVCNPCIMHGAKTLIRCTVHENGNVRAIAV